MGAKKPGDGHDCAVLWDGVDCPDVPEAELALLELHIRDIIAEVIDVGDVTKH